MQWNVSWQYEWELKPAGPEPGATKVKPIMSSPQSFQNSDAIWLDTKKNKIRWQKASSLPNQVSCGTLWWAFSWRTARSQIVEKSTQHSSIDYASLTVQHAIFNQRECCHDIGTSTVGTRHSVFIFTAFFYQTTIIPKANQNSASHSFLQPSNSYNPLPLALIYNYQR